MEEDEAAQRLARVIYEDGWEALSLSEESALRWNPRFRAAVDAYLELAHRAKLLGLAADAAILSLPRGTIELLYHAEWELGDVVRHAELWLCRETGKVVLEIKEWPSRDHFATARSGMHELVLQQSIAAGTGTGLAHSVRLLLSEHGLSEPDPGLAEAIRATGVGGS